MTPTVSIDDLGRRAWRCSRGAAALVRPVLRAVLGLGAMGLLLGVAAPVAAWPAVADLAGVAHLCDDRPVRAPDGRWSCRSAGAVVEGVLLDVAGRGTPPGPPYRAYPWGPRYEPSGYDALDPWLGRPPAGPER
jgi:hypothetical protein